MTTPEDQVPEEPTRRLRPAEAEYSATVLASHWFTGPEQEGATATVPEQGEPSATVPVGGFTGPRWQVSPATVPDRVEGTVLRFGPGVTAAAHHVHSTLPVTPPPVPRSGLRRYALTALVFLCVLAFLAWQRLGPSVEVRDVSVTARPAKLGCGETAQILAQVTTNGRPGMFTYRWFRSDGRSSDVLRERLPRGQRHATLSLRWTFEGKGHLPGRAELRVLTPSMRTAVTRLTYDCR
ncbi:hypothetical protein ACIBJF_50130 [Streptomyces sp. NPDC050743]|uniref:hypothetical protein n=1 Tax=Streptomyces sp. NPDC050743 TaxID=3365634 RepID=UPI0037B95014